MGIHQLFPFLKKKCPNAISNCTISKYKKKKIAYDASIVMYQFATSMQFISKKNEFNNMADSQGNLTGHIMGLLYRNIFFLENGIKPIWVFDGEAPVEKSATLNKRIKNKNLSNDQVKAFLREGDLISAEKYSKRTVHVTKEMNDDAKTLIKLLGMPLVEAAGEAEAQCSVLAKKNKVYGIATEDMDSLTFGAPILLRNFNLKNKILEVNLKIILEELELTPKQFVDFSILCGCDYLDSIKGMGPVNAYNLIKKYKNIEGVLGFIENDKKYNISKFSYDANNFDYITTRKLFIKPNVIDPKEIKLKWSGQNYDKLTEFLCYEKNFGKKRIDVALERLAKI